LKPLLVRVEPGEEVLTTIREAADGRVLSPRALILIGAVDEVTLSVMKKTDASEDLIRQYCEPMEMHGTGEIREGDVHVHATFAGEDQVVMGHVHSAKVHANFVDVYLTS
jgi:hypothetical protein